MTGGRELTLPEVMRATPGGVFKFFRGSDGEASLQQAMENKDVLVEKVRHAREVGCYIEVISLRIQHLDHWLRILHSNTPQTNPREREFGRLLKQCKDSGIEKKLYDQIIIFNKHRVNAIHGFLVGTTKYEALSQIVLESDGICELLAESVLMNAGEVITADDLESRSCNPGDHIYEINACVADLRSRPPI